MSLDSDLLRSMRVRWRFKERASRLPKYIFEEETRFMVEQYARYFREFKECQEIDRDTFITWLFETLDGKLTDADKVLYRALLTHINSPLTEEGETFLTKRITDTDAVYRAADLVERFQNGDELEVADELRAISERWAASRKDDSSDDAEVTDSVESILENTGSTHGLQWPFDIFKRAMRPAQGGDNIIVAARPDVGKTSFLATLASAWSAQLPELEPDDDRCVLWLNNEGPGSRVKLRLWQCVLKATLPELSEFVSNGTLESTYRKVVREDRIRIFDIHGWNTAQVERLIERVRPAVIIWDMADHVRYTGDAKSAAARTDEYLEGLYNQIRELGVRFHAVNLVSTQLSGDAENVQYPLLGQLKDSKTGKQGTADAIITIGFVDIKPQTRFLGLTKNKLNLGKGSSRKLGELAFDGARGYFYVPEEVERE